MANLTLWYNGRFDTDPIRRYVGGSSTTLTLEKDDFTIEKLKTKVHELGYKKYKLSYISSNEHLQDALHEVDKIRDFNNLREIALSTGNMTIFVESKTRPLNPNKNSTFNPGSSMSSEPMRSQVNQVQRRRKHVTKGPKRQIAANESEHRMYSDDEDLLDTGGEDEVENVREQVPSKATDVPLTDQKKCPIVTCDVARYAKLIDNLSRDQRQWVKLMGFKNLLKIKVNKIDPSFGAWVTSMFNARTKTLIVRDNISVPLEDEMVGWVLGIPAGPDLFHPEEASSKEFKEWKKKYKQDTMYGAIMESEVYDMVLSEKRNKTRFQRHFLLYTLGVLLCPMQKHEWISPLHLYMLGNAGKAYKYNWGNYVLDWLVKYREKYDLAKEGLGGCTLLLLLVYLDRIVHGRNVEWSTKSCRLRYWCQYNVDLALKADMGDNGCYGFAQGVENVEYGEEYPTN